MKNDAMLLGNKKIICSGCSACANVCPVRAISMVENQDGFYVPMIDKTKCTQCGLCEKTCPQCNEVVKNAKTPDCYAVMADDDVRFKSSSGGAFTVLAKEIFNRGGVVCGASFDENWVVKHVLVDNENGLDKLRGSKYVQSFVSETLYREIKDLLKAEKWVLFSGTPCQLAGLNNFLGKQYPTLLTVDLICSKVPSKKAFDKFINDNYDKNEVKSINFRSKEEGWSCSATKIYTTTTTTTTWFDMFLNDLCMNDSCANCKYTTADRVSDITIGDFWRINRFKPELDDDKGTSCVLVNTEKGKNFFDVLSWFKKEAMPVKTAVKVNKALNKGFTHHPNSKLFAKRLESTNFNELVANCLSNKYDVGILNWWWNSNRGAILTCYAIQELVKDLGYNPYVIKHIPLDCYNNEYKNSISEKFAKKYLRLTDLCHSRAEMRALNDKFETFMVGSDQVWRHCLNKNLKDFYYLNFVNLNKNKISCAASFGIPDFTGDENVVTRVKHYFSRFNHISVREQDAVGMLKDKFDADGTFILDPVFLIDFEKYSKIAEASSLKEKADFVAYYFIKPDKKKVDILNAICKKLGLKAVNIKAKGLGVEEWLYYIKNAKLVVSDSFHASAYSVILGTKFLTLSHIDNDSRLVTLANITGLYNRFVVIDKFSIDSLAGLMENENWEDIAKKFEPYKDFSINWLKNALENGNNKKFSDEQACIEAFNATLDDRLDLLEEIVYKKKYAKKYRFNCKFVNVIKYHVYRTLVNFVKGNKREKYKLKKQKYFYLINE